MATRLFQQFQGTLEKQIVKLYANVSIGATGAPTLNANGSLGVASISRTSAGLYRITLADKFNKLMHVDPKQVISTLQDLGWSVKAYSMANKTIDIIAHVGGVATDPSNGSELLIEITLRNTSVQK